jgi:YVTN family beta-propeller protein
VGYKPSLLLYNPTANKIYCAGEGSDKLTIIDGETDSVVATITGPGGTRALVFNPTHNKIYQHSKNTHDLIVIDGEGDSVISAVTYVPDVSGIVYNPIDDKLYLSRCHNFTVTVVDGETDAKTATIMVGEHPEAIFHNPDLNRIYCSNTGDKTISVIDPEADTVLATLPVDDHPDLFTYSPVNQKLYCAELDGSSISVIQSYPKPEAPAVTQDFALRQNYPNPFNTSTTIRYSVPDAGPVHAASRLFGATLEIYNILGQKVRTLVDEPKKPGDYVSTWDGKNDMAKEVASGIYLCRLKVGDFTQTKKMLLLK